MQKKDLLMLESLVQEVIEQVLQEYDYELDILSLKPKKKLHIFRHYRFDKPKYVLKPPKKSGILSTFFEPEKIKTKPKIINQQEDFLLQVLQTHSGSNIIARKIVNKQKTTKQEIYLLAKWLVYNKLVPNKTIQETALMLNGLIYQLQS